MLCISPRCHTTDVVLDQGETEKVLPVALVMNSDLRNIYSFISKIASYTGLKSINYCGKSVRDFEGHTPHRFKFHDAQGTTNNL